MAQSPGRPPRPLLICPPARHIARIHPRHSRSAASSPPSSSRPRRISSTSGPPGNRPSASAPSSASRSRARRSSVSSPTASPTPISSRRCTPSSAPTATRCAVGPSPASAPRSGSSPPRCSGRFPRSRSSRYRSAPSGSPSDADVVLALRMDAYTTASGRPASRSALYAAGGLESPVYLDCDFLLGPEAAHLNITGVSGLATKTSAVEFLLASIFQTFPAHKGSVAARLLQREGAGSLLPRPARRARPTRTAASTRGWASGRSRSPTCTTTRPFKADGVNLNTLRTHEALAAQHRSRSSGGCARCSTTRRSCSTATTSTPRPMPSSISSPSGSWAASIRTTCCAASRFRCRASPISRSSSARSSISWRRWARAGRCGRRITSRPSGRSGTG